MKPTKERPDSPYRGLDKKGARLGWGHGGLDCSEYPDRRRPKDGDK